MTEKEIRKQLSETLTKDPENYSKILELSSQLSSFDKDHVRFSVDAGVIDKLGNELVARQETAVSELIKNAYDADSTNVEIIFENPEKAGGTLVIKDDGIGMTRDELVNGFMKISSTIKFHQPNSTLYKRKRAGRKGIGRFAVQRLGSKLSIITQTEESKNAIRIKVDWDRYSRDTNLLAIENEIEEIPKQQTSGTRVIISGLRDKWTESSIKRIYKYVGAILQPFPLSKEMKKTELKRIKSTNDPGFKTTFFQIIKGKKISIADENSMIFQFAVATIEGYIDKKGVGIYSVKSDKLGIKEKIYPIGKKPNDNELEFNFLREIKFTAYYFVYESRFIPKEQRTLIQKLADESGGIRLYKNGFRVLPYGEPFFDWLRLDKSVRSRTILPVHGNNNFFGFIEVTEESGLLEETSSREGLHENEAFKELQDFVYRALLAGVTKISEVRGIKITTGQKEWEKKPKKASDKLKDIIKKLQTEAGTLESDNSKKTKSEKNTAKKAATLLKTLAQQLTKTTKQAEEEESQLLEENSMLRILASLGLTIGEFTHEIRHYLSNLTASVKLLNIGITKGKVSDNVVSNLENNVKQLRIYASYFDHTISKNVNRELRPIEISEIVNSFAEAIKEDTKQGGIIVEEPEIIGLDLFTIPMHYSEWASILFNLYTNSKKAIRRAGKQGKFFIKAGRDGDKIYVEFSDTGDGIPDKIQDKIFDAFFTTSTPTGHFATEEDEILGTGLGLKIVHDIVTAYDGTIELSSPPKGYSTCFRIEVPAATQETIDLYEE